METQLGAMGREHILVIGTRGHGHNAKRSRITRGVEGGVIIIPPLPPPLLPLPPLHSPGLPRRRR